MYDQRSTFAQKTSSTVKPDLIREIIYHIRRLLQARGHYTKELIKKYQISVPQLNCLVALYENGPLSLSGIARQVLVKSSTVTGIIDRLEQKDLVRRTRTSPDRRIVVVELTEAGETLARDAPPPIQTQVMNGLSELPEAELIKISEGLKLLTGLMETEGSA